MTALRVAGFLLAWAAPGAAEVLWQAEAGSSPCVLRVEQPAAAPLEVHATPGSTSRLMGDAGIWTAAVGERVGGEIERGATMLAIARSSDAAPGALRLELAAGCRLDLRLTTGSAELFGPFPAGLAAASTTGDLTFWAHPEQRATVEAATSGELTVDFTVELTYFHHREPAKVGRLTLGARSVGESAPPSIELESHQGAVRVLHPSSRPLLSQSKKELPP